MTQGNERSGNQAATAGTHELAGSNGHVPEYAITFEGKPPKLVLPPVPPRENNAALAAWVTAVFQLDRRHPATGAAHQGHRGPEGHVEIYRAGANSIRFEPASAINTARRLQPALSWQLLPTDGEPYGFKDEHARRIAYVLRLLCGKTTGKTEEQQTIGIISTFLSGAAQIEEHTIYGTGPQKYEAARALSQSPRYLTDANTGELVIRVSDLQDAARRYTGSSLPNGWLDARMDALGWTRGHLSGHSVPGREGRRTGNHAHCDFYRGHLPHYPDEETQVNT